MCVSSGGVSQIQKPLGAFDAADFATGAAQFVFAAGFARAFWPDKQKIPLKPISCKYPQFSGVTMTFNFFHPFTGAVFAMRIYRLKQ